MVICASKGQSVGHLNPPGSQESVKTREGAIVGAGRLLGLLRWRGGDHRRHWDSSLLRRCRIEGEVEEAVIEAAKVTPGGTDSSGGR